VADAKRTLGLQRIVLQPILPVVACYLRRTRLSKGRWRLTQMFLPKLRKLGDYMGSRQITTRHGFKMIVDLGEWIGQHIYMTGSFEPSTARLMNSLLREGDIAIDVGANIGFFTLLASRKVGASGKVHAFEPVPSTVCALRRNLDINAAQNVVVHAIALSNRSGIVTVYEGPARNKGLSSMRPVDGAARQLAVRSAAFDDLDVETARLRLIKIDVEGAEQVVIEGMNGCLNAGIRG